MITLEYSSMCFDIDNYQPKLEQAKNLLKNYPVALGIQIHNSISPKMLELLLPYKTQLPFTIHSPVLSEYFINLAMPDWNFILRQSQQAVRYLIDFNSDIFFFHGFFLTSRPLKQDMKHYRKSIASQLPEHYSLNRSFMMNPECFKTDDYVAYRDVFLKNLANLQKVFPQLQVTLENDFVGIGSGYQRPQEILDTPAPLWFDLGHFWCSSLLHGFDFYEMAEEIIRTKTIPGVHLNHNLMTRAHAPEKLMDSHTHLYRPSQQNLRPLIRKMRDRGIDRYTLEIVDGDSEDLKILLDWVS